MAKTQQYALLISLLIILIFCRQNRSYNQQLTQYFRTIQCSLPKKKKTYFNQEIFQRLAIRARGKAKNMQHC